jgi:hypothetical protein
MVKRKDFPKAWRPFYLLTFEEARALLERTEVIDKRTGFRVKDLREIKKDGVGLPLFMDQRVERLNVTTQDGKIVGVDGCY